jgi:hypothetical protein
MSFQGVCCTIAQLRNINDCCSQSFTFHAFRPKAVNESCKRQVFWLSVHCNLPIPMSETVAFAIYLQSNKTEGRFTATGIAQVLHLFPF